MKRVLLWLNTASLNSSRPAGRPRKTMACPTSGLGVVTIQSRDRKGAVAQLILTLCLVAMAAVAQTPDEERQRARKLLTQSQTIKADDARVALATAEEIAVRLGDLRLQADAAHAWGTYFRIQQQYAKAQEKYESSLALAVKAGSGEAEVEAILGIGIAQHSSGNYDRAIETYQKVLDHPFAKSNSGYEQRVTNNLAMLHMRRSEHAKAVAFAERSAALATTPAQKGMIRHNLGLLYFRLGQVEIAEKNASEAAKWNKESGNVLSLAESYSLLGTIANHEARRSEAIEWHRKALAIYEERKRPTATAHMLIGSALREMGRLDEASGSLEKALAGFEQAGNPERLGSVLLHLAATRNLQKRFVEAESLVKRASELSDKHGFDHYSNEWLLGDALRGQSKNEEALAQYDRSIAQGEELLIAMPADETAQAVFSTHFRTPYIRAAMLFASLKRNEEAFRYIERSRGRILQEILAQGRADVTRSMTSEEMATEKRYRQQLSQIRASSKGPLRTGAAAQEFDRVKRQREEFMLGLYARHPELRVHRGGSTPLPLAELAAAIPDRKTALVEFAFSEEGGLVFVVRKGVPPVVISLKVNEDAVTSGVDSLRKKLAARDLDFKTAAASLYNSVWAPIEPHLRSVDHVIVSPDGGLWEAPFYALAAPGGKYLRDVYTISLAPSLTLWREFNRAPKGNRKGNVMAFGGALADAEREVEGLRPLYPGRIRILKGTGATKAALESASAQSDLLHYATHAVAESRTPMYSHIEVGGQPLQAWEIMNWKLKAGAAILSACETARGSLGGEGVLGLSWAFFVAGVPNTVASHWKVDSAATAELMIEFHRGVARGEGYASALRKASQAIAARPEYAHPFYWASFDVIGAGN